MVAEGNDDRIQRALNEHKKQVISERYGGSFSSASENLPPQEEAQWLDFVEEFERQFESARTTTVRKYIGDPPIRRLADVPEEELGGELDWLIDLLSSNAIVIHFGQHCSDAEMYRFITEELLDAEIDDVHIEGMTTNFVYEEFHPDDLHDVTMAGEDFLRFLFRGREDLIPLTLADDGLLDCRAEPTSREEMLAEIHRFLRSVTIFTRSDVEAKGCSADGTMAKAEFHVSWRGLERTTLRHLAASGTALLRMRLSPTGGWEVYSASLPGLQGPFRPEDLSQRM
jgi:hypothetical protein